jgi:Flp pilus assembly CpaF family ATPase
MQTRQSNLEGAGLVAPLRRLVKEALRMPRIVGEIRQVEYLNLRQSA